MGVLNFPVFPELSARTEYGCDMAGNPGRQNGPKTGVQSAGGGDGGIDWGSSNKGVIIGLLLLICLSNYLKDKHNVQ
ncbi:MAG TPA: hypothetical protein PLW42_11470 [Anaerohalosphaeraceae bacterium]|mgnify:FL=1|nr:hypothetical protein [Anaerohalosphaeraceae bacterium]HQJ68318.1 hypothetical protein [Anaerohalosphaeraceae bacterium]